MPASTTCPFCNAVIASPAADLTTGKIHCLRCDESFSPKKHSADTKAADSQPLISAEVERHRQARQPTGWRSTRGLVIGGIVLAALGVAVGLGIHYWNRDKNPQPPHANVETAKPVTPAEMPGLGYLPAATDSVIAVQFRPLFDALPAGQSKDPRTLLNWIGLPRDSISTLEKVVPIGLENIDQLVLGLKLKEGSPLEQITLVIHTREAFSVEAIVGRLNRKEIKSGDRTVYQTTGDPRFPFDLCIWAPNDRVLVIALQAKDIEQPREGIEHLSPRLVEIVRTQLTPDTYFWGVLDSERWELLGLFLLGLAPEQRQAFEKLNISLSVLRTVTVAVRTDPAPALTVWLELKAEKTAMEFREYLAERVKDEGGRVAVGGAGNRVMLRTPIQTGELRGLIQKLMPTSNKKN